jgi:ABC-type Fe3+ transport system permease subunit
MRYLAQLNLIDEKKANLPVANNDSIKTILTDVFILIGALAFLMVVVSGFRYILARGNPEKITSAKNSLMYSLIGVIVAALAATIVNIVINRGAP